MMPIPDYVWAHLAGWFLGFVTVLGIGWFVSLTKRVTDLETEVDHLEVELAKKGKTIGRLRHRLTELGDVPSEVEDE